MDSSALLKPADREKEFEEIILLPSVSVVLNVTNSLTRTSVGNPVILSSVGKDTRLFLSEESLCVAAYCYDLFF